MSVREMEQLDDQGMRAWDEHDPEGFAALFADRFEWQDDTLPEGMHTRDEAVEYTRAWFTAFPDMRVKTTNRVVSDDAVGAEIEFTGTHTGAIVMGGQEIPPTNRRVNVHGTYFGRAENGRIVEFHSHPNVAELMGQLGVPPRT